MWMRLFSFHNFNSVKFICIFKNSTAFIDIVHYYQSYMLLCKHENRFNIYSVQLVCNSGFSSL